MSSFPRATFICHGRLKPQGDCLGDKASEEVVKVEWGHKGGSHNPIGLVFL